MNSFKKVKTDLKSGGKFPPPPPRGEREPRQSKLLILHTSQWAVPFTEAHFTALFIFSLGMRFLGISAKNQKHDKIMKTSACQCRIRSDRTLSGHLVQESFHQFIRKRLPGHSAYPKLMTAASCPWHCLRDGSQALPLWIPVLTPCGWPTCLPGDVSGQSALQLQVWETCTLFCVNLCVCLRLHAFGVSLQRKWPS